MFLGILWGLSLQNKPNWNDNMSTEIKKQYLTKDLQKDEEFKEIIFINF